MNICVFLGASESSNVSILSAVRELGLAIVRNHHTLVYGAASTGLMGLLADTVLGVGGKVIGVMAKQLSEIEETHVGLTELHTVETIAERKLMLFSLGDFFVTLPGGLGTLEELFDLWSALKVRNCDKPLYLLDPVGFYDRLLDFMNDVLRFNFMPQHAIDLVKRVQSVSELPFILTRNMCL